MIPQVSKLDNDPASASAGSNRMGLPKPAQAPSVFRPRQKPSDKYEDTGVSIHAARTQAAQIQKAEMVEWRQQNLTSPHEKQGNDLAANDKALIDSSGEGVSERKPSMTGKLREKGQDNVNMIEGEATSVPDRFVRESALAPISEGNEELAVMQDNDQYFTETETAGRNSDQIQGEASELMFEQMEGYVAPEGLVNENQTCAQANAQQILEAETAQRQEENKGGGFGQEQAFDQRGNAATGGNYATGQKNAVSRDSSSKVEEAIGKNPGTPIQALPPASQLDTSVLDALPLHMKREIERAYGESSLIFIMEECSPSNIILANMLIFQWS